MANLHKKPGSRSCAGSGFFFVFSASGVLRQDFALRCERHDAHGNVLSACRDSLPVYASGNFHGTVKEYVDEALYYQSKAIPGYKAHPGGPVSFDMEVHQAIREAVGPD